MREPKRKYNCYKVPQRSMSSSIVEASFSPMRLICLQILQHLHPQYWMNSTVCVIESIPWPFYIRMVSRDLFIYGSAWEPYKYNLPSPTQLSLSWSSKISETTPVTQVAQSCPTFLWPQGLYSPWNSPGQNAGVGSLSLLQGIFQTQGSNPGLPHCKQILYHLSHKESPIYIYIFQPYIYIWFISNIYITYGFFQPYMCVCVCVCVKDLVEIKKRAILTNCS